VAQAHKLGLSAAEILVDEGGEVTVSLAVKGRDMAQAIGRDLVEPPDRVAPAALEAAALAISDYMLDRVSVLGDGQACAGKAEASRPDKDGVLVDLRFRCPATVRSITYRNRLFHEFDAAAVQNVLVLAGDDIDQAVLTHTRNVLDLTGERPGFATVLGRYIAIGIDHIFRGYDHIAFLLALLLWATRLVPVVAMATAFTVAHSITLTSAVLGLATVPSSVVEPLIALSVIWAAAENVFSRQVARRWRLAFFLGLIHGFGFAGALSEFGLPAHAVTAALGGFNVGVEIGQVIIVMIAMPLLFGLDRLTGGARSPWFVWGAAGSIGAVGIYWFFERLPPIAGAAAS
jgi:hydrogenase/urease accessory protein HupE